MTQMPQYGQRSQPDAAPECPRHPGVRAVDYCKRCHRPMCAQCAIPTEVRSICVDCSQTLRRRVSASTPVVTYAVMIICAALYVLGWVSPVAERALTFAPVLGYSQPWRFLTTAFLHANIWHIAFNMLALYWVGRAVEPVLGHWRFAVLYVLSAVGGSWAVLAWTFVDTGMWLTATVGASGAVFGVFAAIFVLQRSVGADTRAILVLLGINLFYGFITAGVSWQAHLGGLLTGLLVTWVYTRSARSARALGAKARERRDMVISALMTVGLTALVAATYWGVLAVHG